MKDKTKAEIIEAMKEELEIINSKLAAAAPKQLSTLYWAIEQNKESTLHLAKEIDPSLPARIIVLDSPYTNNIRKLRHKL